MFYRGLFYDLSDVVRVLSIFILSWLSHEDTNNQVKIRGVRDQDKSRSKHPTTKSAGTELRGQVQFLHVPHAHACDVFGILAFLHLFDCIKNVFKSLNIFYICLF